MYVYTHVLDNVIRITLFCVENMVKQYLEETRDHSLFNIATPTNAKPIITNDNFWFMILGEDEKKRGK